MPRGWSIEHCSLIDRCIDRCRKGLVLAVAAVVHARHGGVGVGHVGVVLGVLGQPLAGQRLQRVQRLAGTGLGVHAAEEAADVVLRGIEHAASNK
jgi:hypothetical protein